jgi:hypothetical protein
MGNGSITHSVLWLALVACYDEPEIQLHVTRPDRYWNVEYEVCPTVPGQQPCSCGDSLWNTGDGDSLSRDVAIHINDDSERVSIGLHITSAAEMPRTVCYEVQVSDAMLVRAVDLDEQEPWSCATGACEASVLCTQMCGQ